MLKNLPDQWLSGLVGAFTGSPRLGGPSVTALPGPAVTPSRPVAGGKWRGTTADALNTVLSQLR